LSTGSSNPFLAVATVALLSGTTSSNTQLGGSGEAVLITNSTSSIAYVRLGSDASLQATIPSTGALGDTPVLPSSKVLLRCGPLVSFCAAVLSSGSGLVLFTRGDGSNT
jgi:hypothetical protein